MADLGSIGIKLGGISPLHTHTVSGVVYDANSNPTCHRVRAFNIESGALAGGAWSEETTGAYTLLINITHGNQPVTVVEYDRSGVYNARVFDRVTPV